MSALGRFVTGRVIYYFSQGIDAYTRPTAAALEH
jgi:hypothetical protein